jgi:hypothetical protein
MNLRGLCQQINIFGAHLLFVHRDCPKAQTPYCCRKIATRIGGEDGSMDCGLSSGGGGAYFASTADAALLGRELILVAA